MEKTHIIFDDHRDDCMKHQNNKNHQLYGMGYTANFVVFFGKHFHLLTMCGCHLRHWIECEYMEDLFRRSSKDFTKVELLSVQRGYKCNKDLKRIIKEDMIMHKIFHYVNYIYYDAAGRQYAIVTSIRLVDIFNFDNEIEENYQKSKKYFEEYYPYGLKELEQLHYYNSHNYLDNEINTTTISEFCKLLSKKAKTEKL